VSYGPALPGQRSKLVETRQPYQFPKGIGSFPAVHTGNESAADEDEESYDFEDRLLDCEQSLRDCEERARIREERIDFLESCSSEYQMARMRFLSTLKREHRTEKYEIARRDRECIEDADLYLQARRIEADQYAFKALYGLSPSHFLSLSESSQYPVGN